MKKNIFLSSIFLILIVFNVILLYQNYNLKQNNSSSYNFAEGEKLITFTLPDLSGKYFSSDKIIKKIDLT